MRRSVLRPLLGAGGGFLLGVIWMDLLFDVQAFRDGPDAPAGLASIVAYYGRATIGAFPMNRLIAGVMLATLAGALVQLARGPMERRYAGLAVALAALPIGVALIRVVPDAMRLGRGIDPPSVQASLARSICVEHLVCFALMAGFVAVVALAPDRGRPAD